MEMKEDIFLTFGEKRFKSSVKFMSQFSEKCFFPFICQIAQVPPLQLLQWSYLYGVQVPGGRQQGLMHLRAWLSPISQYGGTLGRTYLRKLKNDARQ